MALYLIDNEHDYVSWDALFYGIEPNYTITSQIMNKVLTYTDFINESKLQDDYRDFFKHVLSLYKVKSPASIKDEKCKKEFFNKIQKGWVKGHGLSEYGRKLMECDCMDENGECCKKES